jgi:hypothetical protein
LGNKSRVGGA